MVLLALVAGMAFAGCSDEESLSEQIAGQIEGYGSKRATIYMWSPDGYEVYKSWVAYELEVPFLVYYETVEHGQKDVEVKHSLLLEDCTRISRTVDGTVDGIVELYFRY